MVSESWLADSFRPAIPTGDDLHYGRLWFIGDAPTPALVGDWPWMAGFGNGGQWLWLMPDADLVTVILSGNYDQPNARMSETRVTWANLYKDKFHT